MNTKRFKERFGGIALATALGLVVAAGFGVSRLRGELQTANQPASLKLADPNEGPSKNSFAPIKESAAGSCEYLFFQGGQNSDWLFRADARGDADGPILPAVLRR